MEVSSMLLLRASTEVDSAFSGIRVSSLQMHKGRTWRGRPKTSTRSMDCCPTTQHNTTQHIAVSPERVWFAEGKEGGQEKACFGIATPRGSSHCSLCLFPPDPPLTSLAVVGGVGGQTWRSALLMPSSPRRSNARSSFVFSSSSSSKRRSSAPSPCPRSAKRQLGCKEGGKGASSPPTSHGTETFYIRGKCAKEERG